MTPTRYASLYEQGIAEFDPGKAADIAHEMQTIDFNEGGNIIPAFQKYTAAYSTKVGGFWPSNLGGDAISEGFFNKLGFVQ